MKKALIKLKGCTLYVDGSYTVDCTIDVRYWQLCERGYLWYKFRGDDFWKLWDDGSKDERVWAKYGEMVGVALAEEALIKNVYN